MKLKRNTMMAGKWYQILHKWKIQWVNKNYPLDRIESILI